jgi:hypothetical protein
MGDITAKQGAEKSFWQSGTIENGHRVRFGHQRSLWPSLEEIIFLYLYLRNDCGRFGDTFFTGKVVTANGISMHFR